MDIGQDYKVLKKVQSLINHLRMIRRRLRYIHLPVMITAQNLRVAQRAVNNLQRLCDNNKYVRIMEAVREIEEMRATMEDVLQKLDISDPKYASVKAMKKWAKQARGSFTNRLDMILRRSRSSTKGRNALREDIIAMIDGKDLETLDAGEENFLQGLLTGKSHRQILDDCPTVAAKETAIRLINNYQFDELRKIFDPRVNIGDVGWPLELLTNSSKASQLDVGDFSSESESEPDKHKIMSVDEQNVQQSQGEQSGSGSFFRQPDSHQKNTDVPDAQRTRHVHNTERVLAIRFRAEQDTGTTTCGYATVEDTLDLTSHRNLLSSIATSAMTTTAGGPLLTSSLATETNTLLLKPFDEEQDIFYGSVERPDQI